MNKEGAWQLVDSAKFVPLYSLGKGSMFRGAGFLKVHGQFEWAPTAHKVFKGLKRNTKSLQVLDVITNKIYRLNHWHCQDLTGTVQLYPRDVFEFFTKEQAQ